MRTLMKVEIPVEEGNRAIQENRIGGVLEQVFADLQPEAAYFGSEAGVRTMWIVFDLTDPSQMPVVAEPLFIGLNARIILIPVMNLDDLRAGLQQVASNGP